MQQCRFCQTKLRSPAPCPRRINPRPDPPGIRIFRARARGASGAPHASPGQNVGQLGKPRQQKIRRRRPQAVQVPIAIGDGRGEGAGLPPRLDVRNFIPHHEAAGGPHPQVRGQGQQRLRRRLQGEACRRPPGWP